MRQKALYFYVAIITVFIVFIGIGLPYLLPYNMFVDGVIYATIAKNLAFGESSLWVLRYTEIIDPEFYAHPPLAFWMQGLFFKLFGTSGLIERFYSILAIFAVGFFVVRIWKELTSEIYTAWLPLLFLILFPRFIWVAANNMLENTLSIFMCCFVFFYLKSLKQHKIYLIIGGLSLFLGVLTKGVVALFPLTLPFWIWLFTKKIPFKKVIADTFILLGCVCFPLVLWYALSADAKHFFDNYLLHQMLPSISGKYAFVSSRFFIILIFLKESILCLIPVLSLFIVLWKKKKLDTIKKHQKDSFVFIALALCAILPIMLTLKQSSYYISPAYPFLAIALALLFQPMVKRWMEKINVALRVFVIFKWMSCVLFGISIMVTIALNGRIGRDEQLQVVAEISSYIPNNVTISIDEGTPCSWRLYDWLHAYFARYKNISLDQTNEHTYYLHDKRVEPRLPLNSYILLTKVGEYELRMKRTE